MTNLKEAIEKYQERLEEAYISGEPRWEVYNVTRRIAQAAIDYGGFIVTGTRHYCPIMNLQIDSVGGHEFLVEFAGGYGKIVQGFTCQYGVFLTRKEAYPIAKAAGQIINDIDDKELYSESYI